MPWGSRGGIPGPPRGGYRGPGPPGGDRGPGTPGGGGYRGLGTPPPGGELGSGTPPGGTRTSVPPGGGGYPDLGTPRGGGGTEVRVPPPGGGVPGRDNRRSTHYTAGSMPLAFTQEDFLVSISFAQNLPENGWPRFYRRRKLRNNLKTLDIQMFPMLG